MHSSSLAVHEVRFWNELLEEEERQYKRAHFRFEDSDQSTSPTAPQVVLRKCCNLEKIQSYFSNFEARKCCLTLTGGSSVQSGALKVLRDEGATYLRWRPHAMSPPTFEHSVPENGLLSEKEFETYKRALLCANYPILSAPEALVDVSPIPTDSSGAPEDRLPGGGGYSSGYHDDSEDAEMVVDQNAPRRPLSQVSGFTSVLEISGSFTSQGQSESDQSVAVLPPEALCDWLKCAFGLTEITSKAYLRKIYEPYRRKTDAKILVDELCTELSLLENDSHPFYNPHTFRSRAAYTQWQQKQRLLIGQCINKVWQRSIPPRRAISGRPEAEGHHVCYEMLFLKLIGYEAHVRGPRSPGQPLVLLSSASRRLLKEFALRYAIGEVYQEVVLLKVLADNFSCESGLVEQIIQALASLCRLFQAGQANMVIVVYEELCVIVDQLHSHCAHALSHVRRSFEEASRVRGVEFMISLLKEVITTKEYLNMDPKSAFKSPPTSPKPRKQFSASPPVKSLQSSRHTVDAILTELLHSYTKQNIEMEYERHKVIAMSDLGCDLQTADISPKLMSRLILHARDEVTVYERSFTRAYQRYLDVVRLAASVLYQLLMDDLAAMCARHDAIKESRGVDLSVLSVAYRQDELDRAWLGIGINVEQQVWRVRFEKQMAHWMAILAAHLNKFLLHSIATDDFEPIEIECPTIDPQHSRGHSGDLDNSRCTSTLSQISLAASEFSAFSAVRSFASLQIKPGSFFKVPTPPRDPLPAEVPSPDLHASNTPLEQQHITPNSGDINLVDGRTLYKSESSPNFTKLNMEKSNIEDKSMAFSQINTDKTTSSDFKPVHKLESNSTDLASKSNLEPIGSAVTCDTGSPNNQASADKDDTGIPKDNACDMEIPKEDISPDTCDSKLPKDEDKAIFCDTALPKDTSLAATSDMHLLENKDPTCDTELPKDQSQTDASHAVFLKDSVSAEQCDSNSANDKDSADTCNTNLPTGNTSVDTLVTELPKDDVPADIYDSATESSETAERTRIVSETSETSRVVVEAAERTRIETEAGKSSPIATDTTEPEQIVMETAKTTQTLPQTAENPQIIPETADCESESERSQLSHDESGEHGFPDVEVVSYGWQSASESFNLESSVERSANHDVSYLKSGTKDTTTEMRVESFKSRLPTVLGARNIHHAASMPNMGNSKGRTKYEQNRDEQREASKEGPIPVPARRRSKISESPVVRKATTHRKRLLSTPKDAVLNAAKTEKIRVTQSYVELICLVHRCEHSVREMCDTLYPIPDTQPKVCDTRYQKPDLGDTRYPGQNHVIECDEEVAFYKETVRLRWNIHVQLVEMLLKSVRMYCNNLLSMDLCGEKSHVAKAIAGRNLVDEIKRMYDEKLIWGCRHMKTKTSCIEFVDKKAAYLSDKFEPVTKAMCCRIEHVTKLEHHVSDIEAHVESSMNSKQLTAAAKQYDVEVDCELTAEKFAECRQHMRHAWRALVKLLIHRINLFIREALPLLVQLDYASTRMSVQQRYDPLISFILNHALALKQWLPEVAFEMALKKLWSHFVKNLEDVLHYLVNSRQMYIEIAENFIQLIALLLTRLCRVGLNEDYAYRQMDTCLQKLHVCCLHTPALLATYTNMHSYQEEKEQGPNDTHPPWDYIERMFNDLHMHRKCFCGLDLLQWIMRNPVDKFNKTLSGDSTDVASTPSTVRSAQRTPVNTYEHPRNRQNKRSTRYSEPETGLSENTEKSHVRSRQTYASDGHTDSNQRRQFESVTAEASTSQNGANNDNPDNATKNTSESIENHSKMPGNTKNVNTGNSVNTDTGSEEADVREKPEVREMGLLEGTATEISEEMRAAQDLAQYLLDKHIIKLVDFERYSASTSQEMLASGEEAYPTLVCMSTPNQSYKQSNTSLHGLQLQGKIVTSSGSWDSAATDEERERGFGWKSPVFDGRRRRSNVTSRQSEPIFRKAPQIDRPASAVDGAFDGEKEQVRFTISGRTSTSGGDSKKMASSSRDIGPTGSYDHLPTIEVNQPSSLDTTASTVFQPSDLHLYCFVQASDHVLNTCLAQGHVNESRAQQNNPRASTGQVGNEGPRGSSRVDTEGTLLVPVCRRVPLSFVLNVIHNRRYKDAAAKRFLESLPQEQLLEYSVLFEESVSNRCFGFL